MSESERQQPMNDRAEGVLRDPVVWRKGGEGDGEIVSYVKDIGNGDPGYNANLRQVLIMKQDGTETVVPESEISKERRQPVLQPDNVPDRRPDQTFPPDVKGADEGGLDENRQARPPAAEAGPQSGKSNPTESASVAQPPAAKATGGKKK